LPEAFLDAPVWSGGVNVERMAERNLQSDACMPATNPQHDQELGDAIDLLMPTKAA
jgi:hypothetical protein